VVDPDAVKEEAVAGRPYKICVIPGDGIGPEVIDAATTVLRALGCLGGPTFAFEQHGVGYDTWLETGESLPDSALTAAREADSILLGAIDVARLPPKTRSPLSILRRKLEVGASIRPSRSIPGVRNQRDDVDVLVVREVTEGLFSNVEYRAGMDAACAVRIITRDASERTARIAFQQARDRRGLVTAAHKVGELMLTDGLFLEVIEEVAADYPDVECNRRNVDTCAMELIRNPSDFDVIVTTNAFGDILSDVGAGLTGGLGLAPSGCIGERWSYFEPVHGSATDIAGRGVANPLASILTAALMLRHLNETDAADHIERAVLEVLQAGGVRTRDLGGSATSRDMTDAVIAVLQGACAAQAPRR
jgi:isocitrate/isopropylmalate dehydrogenase